jgi:hypothetical protein
VANIVKNCDHLWTTPWMLLRFNQITFEELIVGKKENQVQTILEEMT